MNLYYIDSGKLRFFSKKTDAKKAAREEADKTCKPIMVSIIYIAIDRENITRMANREYGFTKYVGRVGIVEPRKRPKLKLRKIAAALVFLILLLPNPSNASSSCVTRKSGSTVIISCTDKNSYSQCRSYKSGSVIKTYCR